ncbi:MAG: glycosyltransferase family 4 protein [bacterium]
MQNAKRKINFISYDLPYPLTSGGKIRAYYLLKALCQDYEATLFSYYRSESQKKYIAKLTKELGLKEARLYKRRWVWHPLNLLKAAFSSLPLLSVSYTHPQLKKDLLEGSGIFHFEAFGPAVYLPLLKKRGASCVFGGENIEWQVYEKMVLHRGFVGPLKFLMRWDVWKMRRLERQIYRLADINLGVSTHDCRYIQKVSGKEAFLVANGVDIEKLKIKKVKGRTANSICFGGDLIYQQNNDALRWLLEKVLPYMKERPIINVVTLTKPKWLSNFKVNIFDSLNIFAPEIYARSCVFAAPIRVGGGTNIKILEAMAVGTPVVTTKNGAEPLGAKDGTHLLVTHSAQDFAKAIDKLLESRKLRDKISLNAYQFVAENYSWQAQEDKLRQIYESRIVPFGS